MAVSATTSSDAPASFSNYGNWIDIAAPGTSILTTNNGGGYGYWNGTSFSSPIAAGLAALIMSANPSLSNAQVFDIITQNADDLGEPGFDIYYGNGRVNVYDSLIAAMEVMPEPDTTEPWVSIISPEDGSNISGSIAVSVTAEDDVRVERVEFYINGTRFGTDTVLPYNFNLDTEGYPEGSYEIWAIAYDSAGNAGQSNAVTVSIYQDIQTDTQVPGVSIISPIDGLSINGSITVKVNAEDNVGIERLELYVNEDLFGTATTAPFNFYWNTEGYTEGWYELSAIAYDASGNAWQSSPVKIYVSNPRDITPPTVSITSPKDGVEIYKLIKIEVSATDNIGITQIELFIDKVCKIVKYESVFKYVWNVRKESIGAHIIEARAYDAAGNIDTETITVYK